MTELPALGVQITGVGTGSASGGADSSNCSVMISHAQRNALVQCAPGGKHVRIEPEAVLDRGTLRKSSYVAHLRNELPARHESKLVSQYCKFQTVQPRDSAATPAALN